jgi:Ca-activated chloride channel homolog
MKRKYQWGILVIALSLSLGAAMEWMKAQNEQQPSTGPQAPVGDTVLVPKKTQPAPKPPTQTEKINPNDIYTLSTATSLVNVEAIVVDRFGNPIANLRKVNFRISDDGVPQSVSNFAVAEAPLTVCMLIEFSNKWWPFLYVALQNAYGFVQFIRPKDWVAVVSFDTKTDILTDFTQNRDEVIGALNRLRFPMFSETDLWDAMAFTIDRMKDIQGRKAILMICSGYDTFSRLNYDQALKLAKSSDAAIYPISILEFITVRSGGSDPIEAIQAKNALNTIAEYSGGKAYFPRFEGELPSDYEQISAQLRAHYSLGFVPTNTARDGRYHKLKVDVVDEQGNPLRVVDQKGKQVKYKVVARDGYYAPKS